MEETYREFGFDTLLVIASGIALVAYMLGVILDPMSAAVVGLILVFVGVITLVPEQARATAAAIGFVAVGLAGIVVPRAVNSVITLPADNELMITIVGSSLVLLLAFALLRLTAFQYRDDKPV